MLQSSHSDIEKPLLNITVECTESHSVNGNVQTVVHLSNAV